MLFENVVKLAIQEAKKSKHYPMIGAVVFKGKKILGSGHNEIRSSSLSMKHRKWKESLHAEQAALLNLDWNKLKGCSILVMRVSKTGKLGICRPCEMCQKIIEHVGIKNVYYTNKDGEIVLEKTRNFSKNNI